MSVTIPASSASKAAADAYNTANVDLLTQQIVDQINILAKDGAYSTRVAAEKVTSAISTALTSAGYTVGSPTNGQVLISWPS